MENRYAAARGEAEGRPDFIDLIDTNFHSCGFRYPARVMRRGAVRQLSSTRLRRYQPDPAGAEILRSQVARFYRDGGVAGDPDHVVITASASESYSHIFAARCAPGDRVLLPRPGYPLFEDVAGRHALGVDFYDQRADLCWKPDWSGMEAAITPRTRAVVLISPNNPTGHVLSEDEIREVGTICRRHNLFLVVDEVFSGILFTSGPLPRPARLLPELLVFTINGTSKLFASPELKVSWILVTGPAGARATAIEELQIQNDLFLSAAPLNQSLAAGMLARGPRFTQAVARAVAARRNAALAALAGIEGVTAIPPSGGIHLPLLIETDAYAVPVDDEDVAVLLLARYHTAMHPGYLYGISRPALVMSYLSPEGRIRAGIDQLRSCLRALRAGNQGAEDPGATHSTTGARVTADSDSGGADAAQ